MNIELKPNYLALLPKFHGLSGEDPYNFLDEFVRVCNTLQNRGVSEDYILLASFPFSLIFNAANRLNLIRCPFRLFIG